MRHAALDTLPAPGARQLRHLGFHQLAHDHRDRIAQQVCMLAVHRSRDDISRGHHPILAIVVLLLIDSGKSRRAWTPRWSDRPSAQPRSASYTTTTDMTPPVADASQSQARFELVAGERRWRACALAQLPTIRAIVEGVDNATSAEMALTENMARDDLNPIEEAQGCAMLRDNFGLSAAEIARRVGRTRTVISHLIRLLELPDVALEHIATGVLSEGQRARPAAPRWPRRPDHLPSSRPTRQRSYGNSLQARRPDT
jgi:ParB-like nuclease domain